MKYFFIYLFFIFILTQNSIAIDKKAKMLLIDTAGKKSYYYQNIHSLAHSVGFKSDYKNLYQSLDNPQIGNSYDAIVLMLSRSFLFALDKPITKQILNSIIQISKQPNKTVTLLFPDLHYQLHKNIIMKTLIRFDMLNKDNLQSINTGINTIFSHKSRNYDTTLFPKQSDNQTDSPLGFMVKRNKTIFFISKLSDFNFADIEENFRKNPINNKMRRKLLKSAQSALHKLYCAIMHNTLMHNTPNKHKLPKHLTSLYIKKKKKSADKQVYSSLSTNYNWIKNGISCAWLDQGDYFADNDRLNKITNKEPLLHNGIKILYNAQFNLLWFELVPEFYLSPHGRKKDKKEQYIQEVKAVAQKIRQYYTSKKADLPKLFVGMNITSNFATHPVTHPMHSIYGQTYNKIPCPLDKQMWKTEVIDMFNAFYQTFGAMLPIDGIFFDFEMYHAPKQAGAYTDLMIFSDPAWHTYYTQINNKKLCAIKMVDSRITYLQQNKQFQKYIHILEDQAEHIGIWLKKELRQIAPNIIFAAYAPTLPNSWFYRGILRGLSSKSEPILYATFNTNYYQHHDWLNKQGIHLVHGAPIMLSKLKNEKNFNLIPYLKKQNHFVWYNRPSRMVYQYSEQELNKVYWGIEASPIKKDIVARSIKLYERKQ